jgi:hypothetical protein
MISAIATPASSSVAGDDNFAMSVFPSMFQEYKARI